MTEIELMTDRLEHTENNIGIIFATANKMFQDRDQDKATSTLTLLTSIGAHAAAMRAICNKLKAQIEVLSDLESEEKNAQEENSTNAA